MIEEKKKRRNHEVKLKFDREEMEKLEKKAKALSLKTSQFIRMVSINCNIDLGEKK
jgi:hypothetical protein